MEQVKTTGAQLFDASKIPTIEEGEITLKYDGNGSLILNGKGHVNVRYDYSHEATAKLLKPGKLTFLDKNNNNIGFMQACIFVDGKEVYTAYINGNAISLPEEELNNPTTFLQLLCYTAQSDATYNNVIFKPMLYQDGNGEWEPFTDGKPAPAPDNPAPIEVTAHPVTVTIKGGTEQQSVTLVPPRPLTKWDKLEKVDGVWRWAYSTEIYTITGNENWNIAGENYYTGTSTNARIDIFDMAKDEGYMECLPYVKYVWNDIDAEGFTVNSSQFHVRLKNTRINISDDATKEEKKVAFEAYLKKRNDSGRPLVLVYESKNVQYIPLPQPVQDKLNALTMYTGTTEIANDGGCNMELTYTVDTQSYVDTKIAEIGKAIL